MRILVIKLGALGDSIHAFHAFAALRAHHRNDRLTLLTTAPFAAMAQASPWFDEVVTDPRAPWWDLAANRGIGRLIGGFDMVYDLQTSRRSNRYFRLAGRPPWSGIAPGCAFPHANPRRDFMHTVERQREQLQHAGVLDFPVPDRAWLIDAGDRHGIVAPYALLVPGGAGVGDAKRWPIANYAEAARRLAANGLTPVVIGGPSEIHLGRTIRAGCPRVIDLTGQTSVFDIAALGAQAALALGNDTGPLHLAASVGAPAVALFSVATEPDQAAPRGPNGEWGRLLRQAKLADLAVDTVMAALRETKAEQHEEPAADRD